MGEASDNPRPVNPEENSEPEKAIVPRHPEWIRVRMHAGSAIAETSGVLRCRHMHTVCEEAQCPNLGECYSNRTATFMILGNLCTRNCGFCAVLHADAEALHATPDPSEPTRLAHAASELGLRHVVITSVTRDDLPDGGAAHFAACANAVRAALPSAAIEVLIPDFRGQIEPLQTVLDSAIDVLNHNIETVPRLYVKVRPQARYWRSLLLLHRTKRLRPGIVAKSGLMVGLGEDASEIGAVLLDLREAGCDIVTIGQYLQPSGEQLPVSRYVHPREFHALRSEALSYGFGHVEAGPFVRSSYHAWSHFRGVSKQHAPSPPN